MGDRSDIRIVAGNANRRFAEAIAGRAAVALGVSSPLAGARIERFSDSEVFVEIHDNIRGADVFVVQPTSDPANDSLMELLIIIDALKRSSAHRITATVPYFGYARQDRKTAARTPISAKLVANLLTVAGADRLLTMDLHSGQIQGFFDIPADNLSAVPVFALDVRIRCPDLSRVVVVSPDVGGLVRARNLATRLGAGLAVVDKRRPDAGVAEALTLIGEVGDRDCILVDDICDSAGTLAAAAGLLARAGARSVSAYASHGVLSGRAVERIMESDMRELVVTDSIQISREAWECGRIRVVSVAPMFAQAILNVARNTSVSSLFHESTLAPMYNAPSLFDGLTEAERFLCESAAGA